MRYVFEWDPDKAHGNQRRHGIRFDQAATVFHDPHALSIFDDDHSHTEDRWVTLGLDQAGRLLTIIHTFQTLEPMVCRIRLISARKATRREQQHYTEGVR